MTEAKIDTKPERKNKVTSEEREALLQRIDALEKKLKQFLAIKELDEKLEKITLTYEKGLTQHKESYERSLKEMQDKYEKALSRQKTILTELGNQRSYNTNFYNQMAVKHNELVGIIKEGRF